MIPASDAEIHNKAHALATVRTLSDPLSDDVHSAEGGTFYDHHKSALYPEQRCNLRFFVRDIWRILNRRNIILMAPNKVAPSTKSPRWIAITIGLPP
jgi:hypothetical protein